MSNDNAPSDLIKQAIDILQRPGGTAIRFYSDAARNSGVTSWEGILAGVSSEGDEFYDQPHILVRDLHASGKPSQRRAANRVPFRLIISIETI